jgi:hypothetical protein
VLASSLQAAVIVTVRRMTAPAPQAVGDPMERRIRIEQHSGSGSAWFAGWLFTIGYLQLAFWKAVLAVVLWPYFLGVAFRAVAH